MGKHLSASGLVPNTIRSLRGGFISGKEFIAATYSEPPLKKLNNFIADASYRAGAMKISDRMNSGLIYVKRRTKLY